MMDAEHQPSFGTDVCRYCGVRATAIEDGHASRFCTHISGSMPICPPVSLGIIVTFILLWGLFHG